MKTVYFRTFIILFVMMVAAVVYGQYKKHKCLVVIGEPDVHKRYPHQYRPIQFIEYTQKGLWFEKDLPKSFFVQPYSLSSKPAQKDQWSLMAVGDIMAHADLQVSAYLHSDDPAETSGGYDWMFKNVTELFSGADVVLGNLETPISPRSSRSGYPRFNADPLLLDALRKVDFDILFTANNHALDQGEEGVIETHEQLEQRNLLHLGTNHPARDKRDFLILSIGDSHTLKIAFLNYTFVTNIEPPNDRIVQYLSLDVDRVEKIAHAIKAAKNENAEYIVVFLHWGQEYHAMPMRSQREVVKGLCLQGADMIIGSGPHVIQPMEIIYSKGGKILEAHVEGAKEHFVAYSLGNFISHQRGMPQYGMALEITIAERGNGFFMHNAVPHNA